MPNPKIKENMKMYPIAVQLYSLRGMMQAGYEKEDFIQVLKWVADVGYKGVEPAGFWGLTRGN